MCIIFTFLIVILILTLNSYTVISHKLIIKITRKEELPDLSSRVVWAPNLLLPVEGQETILALSTGSGVTILNIDLITKDHGNEEVFLEDIDDGVISMPDCHKEVSEDF